jgi:hypothetical protein
VEEVRWSVIPGFPTYVVNNMGQILNIETDRLMMISYTQQGNAKISLVGPEGRQTLSVARMVAESFVLRPNPLSDSVIVLNGNQADLRAANLAWRPGWFAWKYTRQLKEQQPIYFHNLTIHDIVEGWYYKNVIDAGQRLGLLYADIWRSTYTGDSVYPGNSIFRVVS